MGPCILRPAWLKFVALLGRRALLQLIEAKCELSLIQRLSQPCNIWTRVAQSENRVRNFVMGLKSKSVETHWHKAAV